MDEVRSFGEKCHLQATKRPGQRSREYSSIFRMANFVEGFAAFHPWRKRRTKNVGGGRGTGIEPSPGSPSWAHRRAPPALPTDRRLRNGRSALGAAVTSQNPGWL